ncbi:IS5 family transposase [Saccharopolyspora sp. 5N708]|uniref:IS5 family transposase n=1 Tax=Saccharopolyspora sp. 5N708 TaxID=3457424 RepID=UPI003FD337F5
MPLLPSLLIEPVWGQFAELLPQRPEFDPKHPLGCHRRRIDDRVVFDHIISALVHGSGYERIATRKCSDRTIQRRLDEWAELGIATRLNALCLAAFDRMIGLRLDDLSVDGCITKAPCGGQKAGPSPVDRRKGELKRSMSTEKQGVPLGIVSAGANRHDWPLLEPTLRQTRQQITDLPAGGLPRTARVHPDSGHDSGKTRDLLDDEGLTGVIARKGLFAPIQAGTRWVVERGHSWMNNFGKLRRCTDRNATTVDFYLYLAAAIITVRQLIHHARTHYRWDTRPTTRRLK